MCRRRVPFCRHYLCFHPSMMLMLIVIMIFSIPNFNWKKNWTELLWIWRLVSWSSTINQSVCTSFGFWLQQIIFLELGIWMLEIVMRVIFLIWEGKSFSPSKFTGSEGSCQTGFYCSKDSDFFRIFYCFAARSTSFSLCFLLLDFIFHYILLVLKPELAYTIERSGIEIVPEF